jgi:hypothetical protein
MDLPLLMHVTFHSFLLLGLSITILVLGENTWLL